MTGYTGSQATRDHTPHDWFTPGVYPSCSCGFTPRDNAKLNQHWADHGIRWFDNHGGLVCEKVTA